MKGCLIASKQKYVKKYIVSMPVLLGDEDELMADCWFVFTPHYSSLLSRKRVSSDSEPELRERPV